MPGTPGTSLRCNECRKRRKKCDLLLPHCTPCLRSNLLCSGARSHPPFIHLFPSLPNSSSPSSSSGSSSSLSTPFPSQRANLLASVRADWSHSRNSAKLFEIFGARNREFLGGVREGSWKCRVGEGIGDLSIGILAGRELGAAPMGLFCAQVLDEFRSGKGAKEGGRGGGIFSGDRVAYARNGKGPKIYSAVATLLRGLAGLVVTGGCPLGLRVAVVGVLVLYVGRLKGDRGLVMVARGMYASSLERARKILEALGEAEGGDRDGGRRWFHPACLAIALQLFEFIDGVDHGSARFVHGKGALEMMARVGSMEFDTPDNRPLLRGFRSLAIWDSIFERSPNLLLEQEWVEVASDTSEWCPRQHLLDLASAIPYLLSKSDALSFEWASDAERIRTLANISLIVNESIRLHEKFESWQRTLGALYTGSLFWNRGEQVSSDTELDDIKCQPTNRPVESQLEFLMSPIAGLLVAYWSFRLKLWMAVVDINSRLMAAGEVLREVESEIENYSQRCRHTVTLILEAVPYLSSCLEGSLVLQAPFQVVEEFFHSYNSTRSTGWRVAVS